jgi:F-type H+-transporting ATPase subunit delta
MSIQKIAGRYAKSLIDLAIEQNKLEVIKEDVKLFKSVTSNREFYLVMKSPIINAGKKQSILKAIFEGKLDATTMAFLNIIVVKGREAYLPEIADSFMDQYNAIHQLSKLTVTTAVAMDDAALDSIRKKVLASGITTTNLEIIAKVDPAIIGGFILEFGDRLYDDSITHKLELLKQEFKTNYFEKQI